MFFVFFGKVSTFFSHTKIFSGKKCGSRPFCDRKEGEGDSLCGCDSTVEKEETELGEGGW